MYCQLGYLGDCLPGRIRHALDELPETLDGTYERTLQKIKSTNWEFARRLFLCVAVASRPLRVEELAEFLTFDVKTGPIPKFREDWRVEDPLEAVLSICSTLLAVVEVNDSLVMQFSHFTVKEFLVSARVGEKCGITPSRYHISITSAHTFVAQACLGFLLHLDENITKDVLKEFPLAEYAARHWIEHARFEGVSENTEDGMKQLFDPCKSHLAVWIWVRNPIPWMRHKRAERPFPPLGSPLHYAAFCGLHTIVKKLAIEHPQYMHSRDFCDRSTPLHLALQRGHMEVARLLVELGADATAQDNQGWTPLHWAAKEGSMDLAYLLIVQGADVTAQDNDGWTPLHWAMLRGSVNISHFLIEHGADLTAQDGNGLTPLHWAVKEGSVDVTRILVEHGADVAAKDNYGSTPLHWAVLKESVELTRLLAEHGADASARDKCGWSPFYWAVHKGWVNIALSLIGHDAIWQAGPMCPSKPDNARRHEHFINAQDLRRPKQDKYRGLLFGRVNAFLSPFLFHFTGTSEARTAPLPPPPTSPHPYFDNASVTHSPIALASLKPKPINLRLGSTSLPFNSNPPLFLCHPFS